MSAAAILVARLAAWLRDNYDPDGDWTDSDLRKLARGILSTPLDGE